MSGQLGVQTNESCKNRHTFANVSDWILKKKQLCQTVAFFNIGNYLDILGQIYYCK